MARFVLVGAAALVVWLLHSAGTPWLKRYATPADACTRWASRGFTLTRPIQRESGLAFMASVGHLQQQSDDMGHLRRSNAILCENEKMIGIPHRAHDDIRQKGNGLYSHWSGTIYFSTSDNSDPNDNGRQYSIVFPPGWHRILGTD